MKSFITLCLCTLTGLAQASTLNIPNTFTPNTPARASDVNANFSATKTAVDDNNSRLVSVEVLLTSMQSSIANLENTVSSQQSSITGLENTVASQQSTITTQQNLINQLQTDLAVVENNSVLDLDGYLSLTTFNGYDTAEFTGVNVQINDGTGTTQGTTNGLGNLQIGYNDNTGSAIFFCSDNAYSNESDCTSNGGTWDKNITTGSHNLIVGDDHSYTSHGAIVAGFANISNDRFSSVLGGWRNLAAGNVSTVSGGSYNIANGSITSVSGGNSNAAVGNRSSVSGGEDIVASSAYDWQAGGVMTQVNNDITNILSNSVLALDGYLELSTFNGYDTAEFTGVNLQVNDGSGDTDGAVNGLGNVIIGYNDQQSGFGLEFCSDPDYSNETDCTNNGGVWQNNVTTGSHNLIIGIGHSYTSYGGFIAGAYNVINNIHSSVGGGSNNIANGDTSSVSGGRGNSAGAFYSSVSGGVENSANGFYSSVSGGRANSADGNYSSISGGGVSVASGNTSSISGGFGNQATENLSSVSGGYQRTALDQYDWVAGGLTEDY